jgi:hypothetical protein
MPSIDDRQPSELVVLFTHEVASRLAYLAARIRLASNEAAAFATTRNVCERVAEGKRT